MLYLFKMNLKGTIIGSNYFTVKVSDDFSSVAEDLGGVTIKADYSPNDLANGFKEMTIKGSDLLGTLNFKNLFSELPANAEFVVASGSKQPGGEAQEKQELLSKSLKKTVHGHLVKDREPALMEMQIVKDS